MPDDAATAEALLENLGPRCFVSGEVRFALTPEIEDGVFHWVVHYQNCGDRDAAVTLMLDVPGTPLNKTIQFDCPRRGAGIIRQPWLVPTQFTKAEQRCLVYADVLYADDDSPPPADTPAPPGIPVQRIPRTLQVLTSLLLLPLFAQTIFIRREAYVDVNFPAGLIEYPDDEAETERLPPLLQFALLGMLLAIAITALVVFVGGYFFGE